MSRNRFGKRGVWRDPHMDVTAVAPAKAPRTLEPPPRIVHPTVKAPEWKCWRVVRLFTKQGEVCLEDIGSFGGVVDAVRMLSREQGKARVLDPNGKVYADNYQPLEARER